MSMTVFMNDDLMPVVNTKICLNCHFTISAPIKMTWNFRTVLCEIVFGHLNYGKYVHIGYEDDHREAQEQTSYQCFTILWEKEYIAFYKITYNGNKEEEG